MHRNFHIVESNNYFDLGLQQGKLFGETAHKMKKLADRFEEKREYSERFIAIHDLVFPDYMQELRGYAKGAEIELEDLFTIAIEGDSSPESINLSRCSTLYSASPRIFGHNEDCSARDEGYEVCVLVKRIKGLSTFEIFYKNTIGGSSFGVNSFGTVVAVNTIEIQSTKKNSFGLSKAFISRKMLDSPNPRQTFLELSDYNRISGYNYNVFQKNGENFGLEFTIDAPQIREISTNYVHTNHCFNDLSVTIENEVDGTLSRLNQLTKSIDGIESFDDMDRILHSTVEDPSKSVFKKDNMANVIVDLNDMNVNLILDSERVLGWQKYSMRELL